MATATVCSKAALLSVGVDSLLIVALNMGFCVCSMFCCALLCVHSIFAIILMRNRELVALLCLSYWCLVIVIVLWLFLTVPQVAMQCVMVVLSVHTNLLFSFFIILCFAGQFCARFRRGI